MSLQCTTTCLSPEFLFTDIVHTLSVSGERSAENSVQDLLHLVSQYCGGEEKLRETPPAKIMSGA